MSNFQNHSANFEAGIIPPDELFDPLFIDEVPYLESRENIDVMNEWDIAHQESISTIELLDADAELLLAEQIQQGIQAASSLQEGTQLTSRSRAKLERAQQVGDQALELLVVSNMRLAGWFVSATMDLNKQHRLANGSKFGRTGRFVKDLSTLSGGELNYGDRMQIASLSLIVAAKKYDGSAKFSTYAVMRMEHDLLRAMQPQSPVYIPNQKKEELLHLKKLANKLEQQEGTYDVSYEAIKQEFSISHTDAVELVQTQARAQPVSWEVLDDYWSQRQQEKDEAEPLSLADILVDEGADLPVETEGLWYSFGKDLDDQIARLPNERDQHFLELYYGLDGGDPMTFEKVGKLYGVEGERVRQCHSRALYEIRSRLRITNADHPLRDWLDMTQDSAQGSLRAIVPLTEADDARLDIVRPLPSRSVGRTVLKSQYIPKKTYSVQEFDALRASNQD